MERITPENTGELAEVVAEAATAGAPLEIAGQGSRRAIGAPVEATRLLDTTALTGVEMYEPEELVFTANAGTPLEEIAGMLAEKGQALPFEPPDLAEVLAAFAGAREAPAGGGTLGGAIACGFSGPAQVRHWAVRDHVLGMRAVNGVGEIFDSGGRVVKNVTGYDLPRLLTASFGTLAVLARVTVRVLPAPERTITLQAEGHDPEAAFAALGEALLVPAEASGAAYLPAELDAHGVARTLVRLEGFAETLKARAEWLRERLSAHGAWRLLDDEESRSLWREVRDARPLAAWARARRGACWLWRLVSPPARAGELARRIGQRFPDAAWLADRAGGLIWLAAPLPPPAETHAAALDIRAEALAHGAQAMLLAAPREVRREVPPFPPLPAALAGVSARLRAAFDPHGILNPGRMPIITLDETPLSAPSV